MMNFINLDQFHDQPLLPIEQFNVLKCLAADPELDIQCTILIWPVTQTMMRLDQAVVIAKQMLCN